MPYNLTPVMNATGIGGLVQAANDAVGQTLILGLVIAVFVVLVLAFASYGYPRSVLVASWISFVITGALWYGSFLSLLVPLAFLTIAGLAALYLRVE